jgi:hypothetical protein
LQFFQTDFSVAFPQVARKAHDLVVLHPVGPTFALGLDVVLGEEYRLTVNFGIQVEMA